MVQTTDVRIKSALPTKRPQFVHAIHKLLYHWNNPDLNLNVEIFVES